MASLMIVCKEDNNRAGATESEDSMIEPAYLLDELTAGMPHTAYGKWFDMQFGSPRNQPLKWVVLTQDAAEMAIEMMKMTSTNAIINEGKLIDWIERHVGKHIALETRE